VLLMERSTIVSSPALAIIDLHNITQTTTIDNSVISASSVLIVYCVLQVILCGGTVNSPQLLMLSGVGPADELRRHNIQLVHHSPGVGSNLHDHLGRSYITAARNPSQSI
jgi:choline dehydrogenase